MRDEATNLQRGNLLKGVLAEEGKKLREIERVVAAGIRRSVALGAEIAEKPLNRFVSDGVTRWSSPENRWEIRILLSPADASYSGTSGSWSSRRTVAPSRGG